MTAFTTTAARQLVINWHITEVCNYSCRYCFGKWEKNTRELLHNAEHTQSLLHELAHYFHPDNTRKQLERDSVDKRIRLNLAGGEPLLYPARFEAIVRIAHILGMDVSCITNGSRLNGDLLHRLSGKLTVLGISVDTSCADTNQVIGRVDRSGALNLDDLCRLVQLARHTNPHISIKINTVVNSANWTSNLSDWIARISPDKWKIFKVLPAVNRQLTISDREYQSFLRRHQHHSDIITAEDNTQMTQSYLMIDPVGRLYQNKETGDGYDYSDPILEVGVEQALAQIRFNAVRFLERY